MITKILIVDDDLYELGGVIDRLIKEGYDVDPFSTPQDAEERLRGGTRYDVVISDLMMPDLRSEANAEVGLLFIQNVLEKLVPKPVIIVLTVRTDKYILEELKGRCSLIMTKPVLPSRLVVEIKKACTNAN